MIRNFLKNFLKKRDTVCGQSGFGLVETIVGIAVFVLIATAAYGGYVRLLSGLQVIKVKNAATALANEQIEIVRNLPYTQVGLVDGLPAGVIPREQFLTRDSIEFRVTSNIRDIDDPFDGTIDGDPTDYSPADYKLVEISLQCSECPYTEEIKYYARVAPQALETQGENGALFVQVFNASGEPLQGASVNIFAQIGTTTIDIDETTNNNGMFQIVNAPTGTEAYQITVTKDGYSTAQTYETGFKPHANVVSGEVTQISFAIDELSDLNIETKNANCSAIGSANFDMYGSKEIDSQVYKYDENLQSNGSGILNLSGIEWDNYTFDFGGSGYDLAGANYALPVAINPGTEQDLDLILTNADPKALLVQVIDGQTGLPLSDASVTLTDSFDQEITLITGQGFINQTDWSGGGGFSSSDGNVDVNNPAGDLKLSQFEGQYLSSGELISVTYDAGTTTNFGILNWTPFDQPIQTGSDSVRFQVATNAELNSTTTWDFIGPDGSSGSYYTNPNVSLHSSHSGDRYLRYKLNLSTASTTFTPMISNVSFTYGADCAPPGQVLFNGLSEDSFEVLVSKSGYSNYQIENILLENDWQMLSVTLSP